jgi:tetratricopeptide (TPR) repeat protein
MAVASRCPTTAPLQAQLRFACLEVLADGHAERAQWAQALAQVEAMEHLSPDRAASVARRRARLLGLVGRLDEADRWHDTAFAADPAGREALYARMHAAEAAGQIELALKRSEALVQHPEATAFDLNSVAWMRLGYSADLDAALALVRKASPLAPTSPAIINTRAAIEAERGDLDEAVHDNWKAVELSGHIEPAEDDWYVAGRIYEQLGLTADALATYKRIARSNDTGVTAYSLAQRRLAALAAPRKAP